MWPDRDCAYPPSFLVHRSEPLINPGSSWTAAIFEKHGGHKKDRHKRSTWYRYALFFGHCEECARHPECGWFAPLLNIYTGSSRRP